MPVELRPEWMRWYPVGAVHKAMVHDLVLAGHPTESPGDCKTLDHKEDRVLFGLAERRARARRKN